MFLRKVKYHLIKLIKNDYIIIFLRYLIRHKKIPNLKNPKTFNEKIAYFKLNNRSDIYTLLSDKYLVIL